MDFTFARPTSLPTWPKPMAKIASAAWRGLRQRFSIWSIVTLAVAVVVCVPLLMILITAFKPSGEVIQHIASTLLLQLLGNTAILVVGVGSCSLVLGVSLAWLTSMCDFPGRRLFSWALLLPMAVPAYVLAFTFIGLFDYTGPVQSLLRQASLPGLPDVRSVWGVILVLSLALYPYVYLLARNAFKTQGMRAMEAARSLGHGPFQGFFKVALPMARPWIVGGTMLVVMETLADFGAVSIFNFDTFTTAIYKAWFGFFSLPAAAKLSLPLILLAFTALTVEGRSRARMGYTVMGSGRSSANSFALGSPGKYLATAYASIILMLAFLIPAGQLIVWASRSFSVELDSRYFSLLTTTLMLGALSSILICLVSLMLSYTGTRIASPFLRNITRVSTLGYALPGTVLAVGIFMAVAGFDNVLDRIWSYLPGESRGPFLQGTMLVMVTGYMVRFLAVGHSSIDSSMQRVTRSLHETARLMGMKGFALIRKVYLPLLRGGVLTAAILVFVDVMKELPITLMTRSFGLGTLATKIFELTSEGEWERAALPAITLIVAGLIPVAILTRLSDENDDDRKPQEK